MCFSMSATIHFDEIEDENTLVEKIKAFHKKDVKKIPSSYGSVAMVLNKND